MPTHMSNISWPTILGIIVDQLFWDIYGLLGTFYFWESTIILSSESFFGDVPGIDYLEPFKLSFGFRYSSEIANPCADAPTVFGTDYSCRIRTLPVANARIDNRHLFNGSFFQIPLRCRRSADQALRAHGEPLFV